VVANLLVNKPASKSNIIHADGRSSGLHHDGYGCRLRIMFLTRLMLKHSNAALIAYRQPNAPTKLL